MAMFRPSSKAPTWRIVMVLLVASATTVLGAGEVLSQLPFEEQGTIVFEMLDQVDQLWADHTDIKEARASTVKMLNAEADSLAQCLLSYEAGSHAYVSAHAELTTVEAEILREQMAHFKETRSVAWDIAQRLRSLSVMLRRAEMKPEEKLQAVKAYQKGANCLTLLAKTMFLDLRELPTWEHSEKLRHMEKSARQLALMINREIDASVEGGNAEGLLGVHPGTLGTVEAMLLDFTHLISTSSIGMRWIERQIKFLKHGTVRAVAGLVRKRLVAQQLKVFGTDDMGQGVTQMLDAHEQRMRILDQPVTGDGAGERVASEASSWDDVQPKF